MRYELEPLHQNTRDEDLLADLKAVRTRLGMSSVSMSAYDSHGKFYASTLFRRFGSWRKALISAGLVAPRERATEEQLFDNLVELWAKFGRQPRLSEMTKEHLIYSRRTYNSAVLLD